MRGYIDLTGANKEAEWRRGNLLKTVIFDIGNVLMDFRWMEYMHSLYGDEDGKIQAINEAIWGKGYWQAMDRGEISGDEMVEKVVQIAPSYEADIRHTIAGAGKAMHRFDYAIPWIKELKALGKQVLYLSNYSEFAMDANRSVLDFLPYMDGGIFSCYVKMAKPDHAIYRCLCEKYGLNPTECLFTDDMPENIQAARECGFQAVLFEGYEKSCPAVMKLLGRQPNESE